jgi:hypothetical protein
VDLTFPDDATNDFTVGPDPQDWTVDVAVTDSWPTGAIAWDDIAITNGYADSVTGRTVRFESGDLSTGQMYCFNWDAGTIADPTLVNPALPDYQFMTGAGQAKLQTFESDGTTVIEETNWSTAIVSEDSITVTAVVPPLFEINFDATTDDLGNLDPNTPVESDGVPIQIKTNAKSGWIMWVKDQEQGLTSALAGYTIDTQGTIDGATDTLVAGVEGYQLAAVVTGGAAPTDATPLCAAAPGSGNGSTTIEAEYDPTGTDDGGTLSANFQKVASCYGTTLPNTSAGDYITLYLRASIGYSTPAATDYTDLVTVVGAGNF